MKSLLLKILYGQYIKPTFFINPQIEVARKHLNNFQLRGEDYWRLERNADFSLYMSSTILDNLNPRLPNTMQVGFIHCREGTELPVQINNFIEESTSPVIYMSLGSLHKSEHLTIKNRDILKKVFSNKRVIWKISENINNKNIMTGNWFPQQDIMAHNKTKLFVSQCGLNSMQEAIYHSLPILCLPLTYEQNQNSETIERKRLGRKLDLSRLSESLLEERIRELLEEPVYYNNIHQLSKKVKDRPVPILQECIFWIEYVLRHQGADHLKSRRRYTSLVEFYHLDILLYIIIGTIISSAVTVLMLGWMLKLLASHLNQRGGAARRTTSKSSSFASLQKSSITSPTETLQNPGKLLTNHVQENCNPIQT